MTPILSRTTRLPTAELAWAAGVVARLTAGEDPRPRIEWERLDEREQRELVALCERLAGDGGGNVIADRSRLSETETRRFYDLVERGAAFELGHFARRAEARKVKEVDGMKFSQKQQTSLFRVLYAELAAGEIWIDDVACIGLLLAQFAARRTFVDSAFFEQEQDGEFALCYDANRGMRGSVDGLGHLDGIAQRLDYLAAEGWLSIMEKGAERRLKLGPKL